MIRLPLIASLVLVTAASGFAPTTVAAARSGAGDTVRVESYQVLVRGGKPRGYAGLGDRVAVRVSNLRGLLDDAQGKPENVTLYVDGMAVDGLTPWAVDTLRQELRFHLSRDERSKQAWAELLGSPVSRTRLVPLSVGTPHAYPAPTRVWRFQLVMIGRARWWFFVLTAVALFLALWWLGHYSALLRDAPDRAGAPRQPYSLGRTQMAFWFYLIALASLFVWLVTNALPILSVGTLGLMGISAVTGLGARLVDVAKRTAVEQKHGVLAKEHAELEAAATAKGAPLKSAAVGHPPTPEQARAEKVKHEMDQAATALAGPAHANFLKDLLTDDGGFTLHRLQMALWTLLLGAVFAFEVWRNLAIPEFDASLLVLMGFSAGTYIGFKFPERQS